MAAVPTSGLQLAGLTVGYAGVRGARAVLAGVVASARPGEVTAVLGPNGAGKSTLLRTVAGLQPALSGTGARVTLDGDALAALAPRERARRVAVLLTDRVDVGLMTGAEVVELGRHPYGGVTFRSRGSDRAAVDRALELLRAGDLAGRRFAEMSDGQRQRVLLARALAQQPRLLVLDEPTAHLDVGSRVDLLVLLGTLARDLDLVVLVSTHEVELALRLCAAAWLIDGRRVLTDEPERLIADGAVQRVFETAGTRFDPVSRTFHERSELHAR